jgi:hypothetical protein
LAAFRRDERLTAIEVVEALHSGLKRGGDESAVIDLGGWFDKVKVAFQKLLESEAVIVPAKARSLGADFEKVYSSAKVVTDIRPIFTEDRSKVLGAVVLHNLCLHYFDANSDVNDLQVRLALDSDDIEKLIEELREGLKKARVAKESLGPIFGENTYVVGEE